MENQSKYKYEKHYLSNHKLYAVWCKMINRCTKNNDKSFKNYGARGISVCDEWSIRFLNFYNWSMDNGYQEGLTLDRQDNDKGYSPINCRWTNRIVQNRNTRKLMSTNTSGYRGVSWNKNRNYWSCKITIENKTINIGRFFDKVEAAKAYDNYIINNNLEHTKNF